MTMGGVPLHFVLITSGQKTITCDKINIFGKEIQIIDGDKQRWLPTMGGPH